MPYNEQHDGQEAGRDTASGTPSRRRVLKRSVGSGSDRRLVYEDVIRAEDLPPLMRKGEAVAFIAQRLGVSPATLYRIGLAAAIPVVYLKERRLRDGTVKPSELRVSRQDLLRFLADVLDREGTSDSVGSQRR